jgi:hypothetical protein
LGTALLEAFQEETNYIPHCRADADIRSIAGAKSLEIAFEEHDVNADDWFAVKFGHWEYPLGVELYFSVLNPNLSAGIAARDQDAEMRQGSI